MSDIIRCRQVSISDSNFLKSSSTKDEQQQMASTASPSSESSAPPMSTPPEVPQRDEDNWDDPNHVTAKPIAFTALKAPETLDVEDIVARTPLGKQVDPLIRQRLSYSQRKELDRLLIRRQKEHRENLRRNSGDTSLNTSNYSSNSDLPRAPSAGHDSSSIEPSHSGYDPSRNESSLSTIDQQRRGSSSLSLSEASEPRSMSSNPLDRALTGSGLEISHTSRSPAQQSFASDFYCRPGSVDSVRRTSSSFSFQSEKSNERTFIGIGRGSGRLSQYSDNCESVQRVSPHLIITNFNSSRTASRSSLPSVTAANGHDDSASTISRFASRSSLPSMTATYDYDDSASTIPANVSLSSSPKRLDPPSSNAQDDSSSLNLSVVKTEPQDDPRYISHDSVLLSTVDDGRDSITLSPRARGIKRERSPSPEDERRQRDKIPFLDP